MVSWSDASDTFLVQLLLVFRKSLVFLELCGATDWVVNMTSGNFISMSFCLSTEQNECFLDVLCLSNNFALNAFNWIINNNKLSSTGPPLWYQSVEMFSNWYTIPVAIQFRNQEKNSQTALGPIEIEQWWLLTLTVSDLHSPQLR